MYLRWGGPKTNDAMLPSFKSRVAVQIRDCHFYSMAQNTLGSLLDATIGWSHQLAVRGESRNMSVQSSTSGGGPGPPAPAGRRSTVM